MKTAVMVKNNALSAYPCDLLIEGEVLKSYNLAFELKAKGVNIIIGLGLSAELIKKLRDEGITFLKIKNLDELDGVDLDVEFVKEKLKRGAGCQSRFKS
ncbi:MAG: hypothetical protein GXO62_00915 [Epsilonproteobacteria bacterium]|nr:hypothetical protein [Campylobacterota bacterium]